MACWFGIDATDGAGEAADIGINHTADACYTEVQEAIDQLGSAGTDSESYITVLDATTVTIAEGCGFMRSGDSGKAPLYAIHWEAVTAGLSPNSVRYLGVQWNGGSPQVVVKTVDSWNGHTEFRLGSVVLEDGLHILNNPQVASDGTENAYHRLYETLPLQRADRLGGIVPGETGTRNLTLSAGELYDGFNEFDITSKDTSAADTFDEYYQDGVGGWTLVSAGTQWDNLQYDDGTGVLATLGAAKYGVHWLYVEADDDYILLYGQAEYNNQADAENSSPPASVPLRLQVQGKFIGRLIFQKSAATATLIEDVWSEIFSPAAVSNAVTNAGTSTANAVARFDGATGKVIKNSVPLIDDSGNVTNGGTYNSVTVETHASRHDAGGGDAMAIDAAAGTGSLRTLGTGGAQACAGDDYRLSNARTPIYHASSHNAGGGDAMAIDAAAGTGSLRTLGTGGAQACAGNDSRLSNARTPTTHASTHQSGGADAIKLDNLATPDDTTDLDATTSRHGLLVKLGGGTTNFLRADGTWNAPTASGGMTYHGVKTSYAALLAISSPAFGDTAVVNDTTNFAPVQKLFTYTPFGSSARERWQVQGETITREIEGSTITAHYWARAYQYGGGSTHDGKVELCDTTGPGDIVGVCPEGGADGNDRLFAFAGLWYTYQGYACDQGDILRVESNGLTGPANSYTSPSCGISQVDTGASFNLKIPLIIRIYNEWE